MIRIRKKALVVVLIVAAALIIPTVYLLLSGNLDIRNWAGDPNSVRSIQKNIENEGLDWTAEENEITELSDEEFKQLLLPEDFTVPSDVKVSSKSVTALGDAPTEYDLTNVSGQDFTTPVRLVQSGNSCWAFSSIAALESKAELDSNNPNLNLNLSEKDLVCRHPDREDGGYISEALNDFKNPGVETETCLPWTGTCSNVCSGGVGIKWGISDYAIAQYSTEQLKQSIVTYGPIIASMEIYSDFQAYSSGIYEVSSGATKLGDHGILIVGYGVSNGRTYWKVKNSWGAGWGENGFFRIYEQEASIASGDFHKFVYYLTGTFSDDPTPESTTTTTTTTTSTIPTSTSTTTGPIVTSTTVGPTTTTLRVTTTTIYRPSSTTLSNSTTSISTTTSSVVNPVSTSTSSTIGLTTTTSLNSTTTSSNSSIQLSTTSLDQSLADSQSSVESGSESELPNTAFTDLRWEVPLILIALGLVLLIL